MHEQEMTAVRYQKSIAYMWTDRSWALSKYLSLRDAKGLNKILNMRPAIDPIVITLTYGTRSHWHTWFTPNDASNVMAAGAIDARCTKL